MSRLRRITVEIDEQTLARAQAATQAGVSATVREALERLVRIAAAQTLIRERPHLSPSLPWEALRGKDAPGS